MYTVVGLQGQSQTRGSDCRPKSRSFQLRFMVNVIVVLISVHCRLLFYYKESSNGSFSSHFLNFSFFFSIVIDRAALN